MFDAQAWPAIIPVGIAYSVDFSPDNKWLAVGCSTYPYVLFYNMETGYPVKVTNPLVLPGAGVVTVRFSPNGKYLAAVSNSLLIYEITEDDQFIKLADGLSVGERPAGILNTLAWSTNNLNLYGFYYSSTVHKYSINPDAKTVSWDKSIAASIDGNIKGLAVAPGDLFMATTSSSAPFLKIWDLKNNVEMIPYTKPYGTCGTVKFSSTGKYLYVAQDSAPNIWVYKVSSSDFTYIGTPATIKDKNIPTSKFDITLDDKTLIVGGYEPNALLRVYDMTINDMKEVASGPLTPVNHINDISVSPNARYVAVALQTTPFITVYETDIYLQFSDFIPVQDLSLNFPLVVDVNSEITLSANPIPLEATEQVIKWELVDDGRTGATLVKDVLKLPRTGKIKIRATIPGGMRLE